ncbi:TPA: hypothetical protein ACH3X3_003563 [Trebouxia sp. C0006]
MTDDHTGLSSAFLHESPSAPHAITDGLVSGVANETTDASEQQQVYSSGFSMNSSATAAGLENATVDTSSGSLATAVPGQLLSSRSSVKDAIAMYEGSHPVSTHLSNSRHTAAQQSSSLSGGAYSQLTSSQSSVAYQTKSLSEGVYGKLYSSKSSVSQIATSPSWDQGEEDELITSSIPVFGSSHVIGSGLSTPSSCSGVASGAGVTSSSGIGRFGGGIGRGGNNKFAVEGKPADGNAATHAAKLDSCSERCSEPSFFNRKYVVPSREPTSCFAHIAFQLWLVASRLDCLALGAKLPLQQGGSLRGTYVYTLQTSGRRALCSRTRPGSSPEYSLMDSTQESDVGSSQETTSPPS